MKTITLFLLFSLVALLSAASGSDRKTGQKSAESAFSREALETGSQVYAKACSVCHDTGLAGAPKLGDRSAWEKHVAKGISTLVDHAINGYQGESGMMPAKGGNPALSDQDVRDAVLYMVNESR